MTRSRAVILTIAVVALVLALGAGSVTAAEAGDVNLVFIHHSVGANWLNAGLCSGLNARGYHVADIYYGWTGGTSTTYGDRTDTSDWPTWFTDKVMDLVYPEMDAMTAPNVLAAAPGENTVIMFKSCYPNSDVGSSSTDERAIYKSLLPYFQDHPDKMFVLVTPPPMASISYPAVTRELSNWLTDRRNGWLKDLTTNNVFTFDLYNVLTHPDAHHRLEGGVETHEVVSGANLLYSGYHTSGDDHPNYTGSAKAAAEFIPLLDSWYQEFVGGSELLPTRFEQTNSRLTYLGGWNTGYSSAASRGSFVSTEQRGSAALVKFTGTEVSIVARTTPWYGKATVSIDGGPEKTVDFYSQWTANRRKVFSATVADGTHTLVLKCEGTKNPASVGTAISLDAIDVLGELGQASTPARYQDTDSRFAYTPKWHVLIGDPNSANGDFSSIDEPGSVAVEFKGTYCAWYGRTTPWYGMAKVILDAGTPDERERVVNLRSPSVRYKQKLYDTGLLDPGSHTLAIYWTGESDWLAWGTRIGVDRFDILGTPVKADPAPPLPGRHEQDKAKITYLGDWATSSTWMASGGSYANTSQTGAVAIAKFSGTTVKVLAKKCPWYGEALVSLDGAPAAIVDLYSPVWGQEWKVDVYRADGLADTEHTLTVECLGQKNPGSLGTGIALDALEITGYLKQAPRPTRIDDNDSAYAVYEPAWSRWDYSGYWAASGDTYASTDTRGDKVTVTFKGTHLSLVSRTAITQGRAKVTLDGNEAEAVILDLYSPFTTWKKRVYSTGLLAYGTHTVEIECLGQKSRASWWYTIGADAFDILLKSP